MMYNRETHKSRGFGFVIFQHPQSADKALHNRMHTIDEKQVRLPFASRRVPRCVPASCSTARVFSYVT